MTQLGSTQINQEDGLDILQSLYFQADCHSHLEDGGGDQMEIAELAIGILEEDLSIDERCLDEDLQDYNYASDYRPRTLTQETY